MIIFLHKKISLNHECAWLLVERCLTMLSATYSREVVIGLVHTALPLQTLLIFSQLISLINSMVCNLGLIA